ncbi:unnamed protein product [Closterium sp. Naga37s-1]|nr:unnamed protein product [Closterium sp. Naga37s-1]
MSPRLVLPQPLVPASPVLPQLSGLVPFVASSALLVVVRAPLPEMTSAALALVAVALAEASPGGVPGRQVPALLRAVLALAGLETSSPPSRERRGQSRCSRNPVYCPPAGRAPACLRSRQQQTFVRTQRRSALSHFGHAVEGGFKPPSEAAAVPAGDASSAVPAGGVANRAVSDSSTAATAAAAASVSTSSTAPGPAASAASDKSVTATPALAASAAATSTGPAISSYLTSSSCCCSCSRDAPPRP